MLISQLLKFARPAPPSMDLVDLAALVTEVLALLMQEIGKAHIQLQSRMADLPPVLGDANQLKQVFVNMILNAIHAMPEGGRLEIAGETVRDAVVVRIADTGHGIAPEHLPRIFDPFFTTKEQGKGTGLGLATVYGVIKQHGGMIDVDSVKGAGTTFTVWLPAVTAASAAAVVEERAEQVGGSETLLVVEDQEDLRNLVVRYLVSLGYEVLEARDGGEGLRRLEQYGDAIALVFTDLVMPTLNGREMYERGRGFAPQAAFVFSSGYHDAAVREGLVDRPGVSFVAKPFQIESLAATIRTQLQGPLRSVAGC